MLEILSLLNLLIAWDEPEAITLVFLRLRERIFSSAHSNTFLPEADNN